MSLVETKFMNRLGLAFILMSSVLLGIWAVKDTIALRNILLALGAFGSIPYLYQFSKATSPQKIGFMYLPLVCIVLALLWVVFHYLFLSISPTAQFKELSSIWLRSALAVLLGLSTGIALTQRPRYISLFWLAILMSFIVLFAQYLPLAWASKTLIVPLEVEDFRRYLFVGKINPMYVGILLIAGSTGLLLDALHQHNARWIKWTYVLWLTGLFFTTYSFAFIINTRSGILISSLIILSIALYGCAFLFRRQNSKFLLSASGMRNLVIVLLFAMTLIGIFAYQQVQRDSGLQQLISDIKIGYQVEKYPNWQNVAGYGFPKNENGNIVSYNTYERAAWATAGVKSIPYHPLGVGILLLPLGLAAKELFPAVTSISTHSGWVDLTLSFGLPMLCLMWLTNFSLLTGAIRKSSPFKYTLIILLITLFVLFTVGELSNSHSLEMLFYLFALMTGMQLSQRNACPSPEANIA